MVSNLRYMLSCFGVDIYGPAELFCDNKSVVENSSVPESVLSKHHNDIFCNRVREAQACGMILVQCIPGRIIWTIFFQILKLLGTCIRILYKKYFITSGRRWKTGIWKLEGRDECVCFCSISVV